MINITPAALSFHDTLLVPNFDWNSISSSQFCLGVKSTAQPPGPASMLYVLKDATTTSSSWPLSAIYSATNAPNSWPMILNGTELIPGSENPLSPRGF